MTRFEKFRVVLASLAVMWGVGCAKSSDQEVGAAPDRGDTTAVTTQVEVRSPHWRRVGAVAFGGIGTVSHALSALQQETWFPSAGVGLRYVLLPKDRTVARVDFALGRGSLGINVGIGEAF